LKNIIVITGGAGFVGSNLIDYFLRKTKYRIISIDNYTNGWPGLSMAVEDALQVAASLKKQGFGITL